MGSAREMGVRRYMGIAVGMGIGSCMGFVLDMEIGSAMGIKPFPRFLPDPMHFRGP